MISDAIRSETTHCSPWIKFASGSFLQVVGDTMGFDSGTVFRVLTDVFQAPFARKHRFIQWPSTAAERTSIKNALCHQGGFSCAIVCVDGNNIGIQVPNDHENGLPFQKRTGNMQQ